MASNLLKSSAVAALLAAAAFHFFVGSHVIHGYYRYFTHPKNVAGQECVSSKCWDPTLSCLGDMACLKTLGESRILVKDISNCTKLHVLLWSSCNFKMEF